MAELDTRGFGSGMAQGVGLADTVIRGREADERADERLEMARDRERRAGEMHDLKTELTEVQVDEAQDQQAKRLASEGIQALREGQEPTGEQMEAMLDQGFDPWAAVSGETLKAAKDFQNALVGEQQKDIEVTQRDMENPGLDVLEGKTPGEQRSTFETMNDPRIIRAANTFMRPRILKGVGETATVNGEEKRIADKRIRRILPSPKEGMVGIELEVATEDGETYTAPLTDDRTPSPDDPIKLVPVDRLVGHAAASSKLSKLFNADPQARQNAQQALARFDPDYRQAMMEQKKRLQEQAHERSMQGTNTVEDGTGQVWQYNPRTGAYDQPVGRADPDKAAGGGGTSGFRTSEGDWRVPVRTDRGMGVKTFSDSDLRNHYKTQFDILDQSELEQLYMRNPERYEQEIERMAQVPKYNEWLSNVLNNGLDLSQAETPGGGYKPSADEIAAAREDPAAYAKVLGKTNGLAPDHPKVVQQVQAHFPDFQPESWRKGGGEGREQPSSGGMIPEAGAAERPAAAEGTAPPEPAETAGAAEPAEPAEDAEDGGVVTRGTRKRREEPAPEPQTFERDQLERLSDELVQHVAGKAGVPTTTGMRGDRRSKTREELIGDILEAQRSSGQTLNDLMPRGTAPGNRSRGAR